MIYSPLERAFTASSKKDYTAVLSHLCVRDGTIQGQDGRVGVVGAAPEFKDRAFLARADKLRAAFTNAGDDVTISVLPTQVKLKSKGYEARVGIATVESYPAIPPSLDSFAITACGPLLPVLRRMRGFISTDASKPWSLSVLFRGGKCWATNNVVIAACDADMPDEVQLSLAAVDAFLSIGLEPSKVAVKDSEVRFLYDDGQLVCRALSDKWPAIEKVLPQSGWEDLPVMPEGLSDAVTRLLPLVPDDSQPYIKFDGGRVTTAAGAHEAEVEVDASLPPCMFHAKVLLSVLDVATHADFAQFPRVPFRGDHMRGLFVGVRVGANA